MLPRQMRRLATSLLRALAEFLIRLYYPRRSLQGAEHLPPGGPTIYVANHPNGLMDPLVLRVTIGRRVRFLAKSTLYANPFGRLAMDAFECLPVFRHQDLRPPGSEPAGATGQGVDTISRNEETFARCRAELARGAELALYPEGTSHSDPQLKPLKSGAARLALSAADEVTPTTITATAHAPAGPGSETGRPFPVMIPVGLAYRNKAEFRSAVHVVVGPPIELGPLVAPYRADPRAAIDALTAHIRARLDELVLQAETRELLAGIARVASWTSTAPDDDAPDARYLRTRTLLQAYPRLQERNPRRLAEVTQIAERYARALARLGVKDPWQLETPRVSLARLGWALVRALALLPVAVWGFVTGFVPYRLAGVVARRMTRDEDVWSTLKMIGGAAFLTGGWLLEGGVLGALFGWRVALGSLVVAPLAGYGALRFSETVGDVVEGVRHLAWRARGQTAAEDLSRHRRQLAAAVADALRELAS
jgi:glycerol-3-phosphate O-acyltransferase/dihydroxyacetone phosphate acyltransferase